MSLEFKLSQRLTQGLVMTPQLQQAIKLLQLTGLEIRELVEQELEQNPFLEEQSPPSDSEFFSASDRFMMGIDFSVGARSDSSHQEFIQSLEATSSNPLVDHLLWQLRSMDLTLSEFELAYQVICNLDDNGYLACTADEIASNTAAPLGQIENSINLVQTLDPAGIAARDLRECLMLQLDQQGMVEQPVGRLVQDYLGYVESGDLRSIARAMSISLEEVGACIDQLRQLNPYPGRVLSSDSTQYIIPDVYVRLTGNEVLVHLNESLLPKVHINSEYKKSIFSRCDKAESSFLVERWKNANWLVRTIEQRNRTLLKVTQSIMRFQHQFILFGTSQIAPLVLRQVAEDVEMHESTISRVTTNKFVHTPHGIFELKFFFSSALTSSGGDVSSEQVRDKIKHFVAGETLGNALSDSDLSKLLAGEGITVARRTVAKYRESLGIPTAAKRNKKF